MPVQLNALVGGVSTSIRLLAGENPDKGYIGVVDGAGQYITNIGKGASNFELKNVAGAEGDHIAKIFVVVDDNTAAQLILKDGTLLVTAPAAVDSATNTTLTDDDQAWTTNEHAGRIVEIVSGTGAGQHRKIVSNTDDDLTVCHAWDTNPDNTSTYQIYDGIELLPYDTPTGVYGITPGINAKNSGGWRISSDGGVAIQLVTGSFS